MTSHLVTVGHSQRRHCSVLHLTCSHGSSPHATPLPSPPPPPYPSRLGLSTPTPPHSLLGLVRREDAKLHLLRLALAVGSLVASGATKSVHLDHLHRTGKEAGRQTGTGAHAWRRPDSRSSRGQ
eukprot:177488-Chlamydomonas_euryale.AAC.2